VGKPTDPFYVFFSVRSHLQRDSQAGIPTSCGGEIGRGEERKKERKKEDRGFYWSFFPPHAFLGATRLPG